jgi:O-antigen ligase
MNLINNENKLRNEKIYFLRKFLFFPTLVYIFLIIVVPSAYQLIKAILLLFIFSSYFFELILSQKLLYHSLIFKLFIVYILFGLIYFLYGLLNHNIGAVPVTKEIVLYVIFYFFIIGTIKNIENLKAINFVLIFSMFFLCFYIITSLLNSFGLWPNYLYVNLETATSDQDINTVSIETYGRLSSSFSSFPGLLFLQPFLFCQLLITKTKHRFSLWALFIIVTILMIFVGRRILLITSILFPIFILFYLKNIKKTKKIVSIKIKWKSILVFVILFLFIIYSLLILSGIDITAMYDNLLLTFQLESVTTDGKIESNVRIDTIKYLFQGWLERPLFGFGNGAYTANFVRDPESPWNYEVEYMQFLYSWGIFGMLLYSVGIIYIIKKLFSIYSKNSKYAPYALPAAFGLIAFLIGSSTNPYLLKLDSLYIVFLPIGIVNLYLIENE